MTAHDEIRAKAHELVELGWSAGVLIEVNLCPMKEPEDGEVQPRPFQVIKGGLD
ncbi:hypothetical protein U0030_15895 [Brevundimonas bullata]|uniref:hypothetical protein n=1 Tax=Brevundimonas bullata TaxID=13160 RepID=UPI0013B371F5|nr:hypothetical protein [Brevundimonas bullata]WQE36720.1 hypothetical protein U0030_15895 [Brevundimonas bullata]